MASNKECPQVTFIRQMGSLIPGLGDAVQVGSSLTEKSQQITQDIQRFDGKEAL